MSTRSWWKMVWTCFVVADAYVKVLVEIFSNLVYMVMVGISRIVYIGFHCVQLVWVVRV